MPRNGRVDGFLVLLASAFVGLFVIPSAARERTRTASTVASGEGGLLFLFVPYWKLVAESWCLFGAKRCGFGRFCCCGFGRGAVRSSVCLSVLRGAKRVRALGGFFFYLLVAGSRKLGLFSRRGLGRFAESWSFFFLRLTISSVGHPRRGGRRGLRCACHDEFTVLQMK
jgi:hypothetical protein